MAELLAALGWIGAGLAALLATVLCLRRGTADRRLGGGLAAAGLVAACVVASHSGHASRVLEAVEVALTLAAGPLFAGWIAALLGMRLAGVAGVAFVPAALWLLAGLAGAPWASHEAAIRGAVAFQMAWSLVAAVAVVVRLPRSGAEPRRIAVTALAGMGAVHVAQALRLFGARAVPRDVVPATLGVLLAYLAFLSLRHARVPLAPAGRPLGFPAASPVLADLDRWLVGERAFTDHGLTVALAARRLGVTPTALSRSINGALGRSFAEHLAGLRIAEAERLLRDAGAAHLTVEAIGSRAGFRSRSAFFAAFRRATGQSPADYRRRFLPPAS